MSLENHIRGNIKQYDNKFQKKFFQEKFFLFLANKTKKIEIIPSLIFDGFSYDGKKTIFFEIKDVQKKSKIITSVKESIKFVDFKFPGNEKKYWKLNLIYSSDLIKFEISDFKKGDFILSNLIENFEEFGNEKTDSLFKNAIARLKLYSSVYDEYNLSYISNGWNYYFDYILKAIAFTIAKSSISTNNNNINFVIDKILKINDNLLSTEYFINNSQIFHDMNDINEKIIESLDEIGDYIQKNYKYKLNNKDREVFKTFLFYIYPLIINENIHYIRKLFNKKINYFYLVFYSFYNKTSFENINKKLLKKFFGVNEKNFLKEIIDIVLEKI